MSENQNDEEKTLHTAGELMDEVMKMTDVQCAVSAALDMATGEVRAAICQNEDTTKQVLEEIIRNAFRENGIDLDKIQVPIWEK